MRIVTWAVNKTFNYKILQKRAQPTTKFDEQKSNRPLNVSSCVGRAAIEFM